jgi:WD40 repeat protein
MDFDKSHRKLIVGDHLGHVKVFDLLSGIMTHELDGHDPIDGEISFIGYGDEDSTIITCGWDRVIKIHSDEKVELKDPKEFVLRGKKNCHKKDIISGDYSHNLGLIATGSRDNTVRIWDYEKVKLEEELVGHTSEVVIVKFLNPYPILLTADNSGQLYLWLTKPHAKAKSCLVSWRNMFTLQKMCPITAVDSHYDAKTNKFTLIIADEMGYVRVQDISSILNEFNLQPVDVVTGNFKRNPWRVLAIDKAESGISHYNDAASDNSSNYGDGDNDVEPLLKEF